MGGDAREQHVLGGEALGQRAAGCPSGEQGTREGRAERAGDDGIAVERAMRVRLCVVGTQRARQIGACCGAAVMRKGYPRDPRGRRPRQRPPGGGYRSVVR